MPTGPSAILPVNPAGGPAAGPALVAFPPRADGLDFRRQLESKYTAMGRLPAQTYVDMEGEVAWIGEYYRYRVNGCDHATATQRSLSQVDGAAPGPVCSVLVFPETAVYPPRDQVVDFRRQLGAKYQSMGRSFQSAVDPDGAAIWMGEYFRYRSSGCDHPTSVSKVLSQVDGNPATETCTTACAYNLATPVSVPGEGGTFSVELVRTSGSCDWVADSEAPWMTLTRPITGTNRTRQSYTVAANPAGAGGRSGTIRFVYPGGISYLTVNQGSPSYNLGIQLFDPARTASPVTECHIRTTATICTLTATTTTLPPAGSTFEWRVEYAYAGAIKVRTQSGTLTSFSFTETCAPSPADGALIPIMVTLTGRDPAGNSGTIYSGQGNQAPLYLRSFNCP